MDTVDPKGAANYAVHVYHFTYHAYGSWMPDREEGFVQKQRGIQPPNEKLARAYRSVARFPQYSFDTPTQEFLIDVVRDVCMRRAWRLHGIGTDPSHIHVLVSWGSDLAWELVRGKIKNIMSTELSRRAGTKGQPWFAEGASRKRVQDDAQFHWLMKHYLPGHQGVCWFEKEDFLHEAPSRPYTNPPLPRGAISETPAEDEGLPEC